MACQRKKSKFLCIVEELELSILQKNILKERYVSLVEETQLRAYRISIIYHTSHVIVTVGSLIVPALLSIQYITPQNEIYWVTWVLSLLVTTCNGLLTLFKIDKKYLYLHTNKERLITEGWQFSELSGHYSGFHTPQEPRPTHANQFIFFCHAIEKIRMRQIDDEYNKKQEGSDSQPAKQGENSKNTIENSIIPITPLNPLQTKKSLVTILEEAEIDSPQVDGTDRPVSVPIGQTEGVPRTISQRRGVLQEP
jgi:hypothetical protein